MNYRVGLGGNYYYTSLNKEELVGICNQIDKSPNSIYWNNKYKTYVIRIKSAFHKTKASEIRAIHNDCKS
jgi:hypothetical protein